MAIQSYRANQFDPTNLMLFFGIAFGWTWAFNTLFISGLLQMPAGVGTAGTDFASLVSLLAVLLPMPFGPTIGGFVIAGKTRGREGVRELWKRFWSRRFTIKWLIPIFAFYPLYFLIARASGFILGMQQPALLWLNQPLVLLGPFLASCLHGGLSEEFGWRGFALPMLQARFDATTSSIILGIIEGLWHLPLAFIPGLSGWEGRALFTFFIWWIPVSITRTWIFNNTNGSVLAAMLFHAMGNTVSEIIPINVIQLVPGGYGYVYMILLYIPVVIGLVLVFGYRNLVRERAIEFIDIQEEPASIPTIGS
ncbi:MAG: type II CAAX prenyl endopeptidase Rce1 family protein [Candidatus Thorarchaeota archaeon]